MKKILFTILVVFSLCLNPLRLSAQLGEDKYDLVNATVLYDKGKYDNLYIECTANNAIVNHYYNGNAGFTKNVEIYIQAGWTITYVRNPGELNLTNRNTVVTSLKSYHSLIIDGESRSQGNEVKTREKEAQFMYLNSGENSVYNTPPSEVQKIEVTQELAATSPVHISIFVKRYGFKINYYANGVQFGNPSITWSYNQTNTIPVSTASSPSKEGYTFLGWNQGSESTSGGSTITSIELNNPNFYTTSPTISGDPEDTNRYRVEDFYAQWSPTPYTITYNANGGSCSISSEPYTIETATRNTPTPSRWGYDFKGWKVVSAEKNWTLNDVYGVGIKQLAQGLYGNVTLEAQWAIKTFPVVTTFSAGKGTSSADQIIVYNQNSSAVTIEAAKNYRITSVKVVMSIDGTDVEKINQTYNPSTNPVSSYTIPSMKIEGSTTVTVTTERVSADVTLSKQNLTANDCSIIIVSGGDKSYTVILTQSNKSVTLNEVPLGTYSITETNWSYTYEKSSSSVPSSFTIANTDTDDKSYEFNGAKNASGFNAEKYTTK